MKTLNKLALILIILSSSAYALDSCEHSKFMGTFQGNGNIVSASKSCLIAFYDYNGCVVSGEFEDLNLGEMKGFVNFKAKYKTCSDDSFGKLKKPRIFKIKYDVSEQIKVHNGRFKEMMLINHNFFMDDIRDGS